MDRRERYESFTQTVITALDGRQREIWTALPTVIQSFDPSTMSCTAAPAIPVQVRNFADTTGKNPTQWVKLPLLTDVPVVFVGGGGLTLTFPIEPGDEALVIFASRCIDAWWYYGWNTASSPMPTNPPELRVHDLSDGFAIVGIRSKPRVLSGVSTTSAQLRTDDGQTFVDIKAGVLTLKATSIVLDGNVSSTGTFTNNEVSISSTHKHFVTEVNTDTEVPGT